MSLLPISAGTASGVERLETGEIVLAFGDYLLFLRRRQLLVESKPIELGSRAFDTLLTLVEAEGRLVTKDQLLKRVWPNSVVEEKNVSVQIATLRKALGTGRELIKTDSGRGYRFAGTVRRIVRDDAPTPSEVPAIHSERAPRPPTNLPAPLSPLIGRERELDELPDLILNHRLITLTGPGGIGKTQLGLELARRMHLLFGGGAWVVELGPLANPELVAGTIACTLGIEAGFERMPSDFGIVGDRSTMLVILDSCEHVIDAAARTAETLLRALPGLHLIATSREPLATEGEHIYRVAPLKVPPASVTRAAQAMEHSAVQLFVDRVRAAEPSLRLEDRDVLAAGKICRGLDGIPLAIELAAANAATVGLDVLASRLHESFDLLAGGRRTALPRHQTLRATLDWSYGLLDEASQAVFRRLAIFSGGFTFESATDIVALAPISESQARRCILDLVSKSLVTLDLRGTVSRYRLLDTTRAYAKEKLSACGELYDIARRHALHYRTMLERAATGWQTRPAPELVAAYAPEIDNIRAALDFAFASDRDWQLGVALTAAAVPLWMLLSILGECRDLVTRALSCLGAGSADQDRHEMLLQSALATSSMWSKGPVTAACAATERTFDLAERLNNVEYQLRALYVQWIYRLRVGEYRTSYSVAARMRQIAEAATDLPGALTGARLEGVSLHYLGDQGRARSVMEYVTKRSALDIHRAFVVRFGLDQRCAALVYLARILWLQGFPEQALRTAQAAVDDAFAVNHANSLGIVLCDAACGVAAMCGNLKSTQRLATKMIEGAQKHGLGMWQVYGLAFQGWVAIKRGAAAKGVRMLYAALNDFREIRVELRYTIFIEALAEALARSGRIKEASAIVDDVLQETRANEGHWCLPELLRIRAELLLAESGANGDAADEMLREALALAHQQGTRSWELRAGTSIARLWHRQGRGGDARNLLLPIYESFTEGFETADLRSAKALIDALR